MDRRRFLELAGVTAGMEIAGPFLKASPNSVSATYSSRPAQAVTMAMSLDGEWFLALDPGNAGREQRWFLAERSDAKSVKVPSIIQEAFPAYHGVVWYWHNFEVGPHPLIGGRYLLRFNAVDYLADVWLNGISLGSHEGGETPFVLDLTDTIQVGKLNKLAVRVLNPKDEPIDGILLADTPHRNKFVKYTNGALADYGGIIEPVELLLTPAIHISNVFVRPDWKTGQVTVTVTLESTLKNRARVHLQMEVTGAEISQATGELPVRC